MHRLRAILRVTRVSLSRRFSPVNTRVTCVIMTALGGHARVERGRGHACRGTAVRPCPPPPLEFLRAGLYPPSGVVLHCWVGLIWVPIVGPADPILRVETAFKESLLALH